MGTNRTMRTVLSRLLPCDQSPIAWLTPKPTRSPRIAERGGAHTEVGEARPHRGTAIAGRAGKLADRPRLGDAQVHRAHDRGRRIEAELAWWAVAGSRHVGEVDPLPLELRAVEVPSPRSR